MKDIALNFEIGFWHPFGPHAGETAKEILERKKKEIEDNGWTLWSFQYRTPETLDNWYKEILNKKSKNVLVFCSEGLGTKEPKSQTKFCKYYKLIGSQKNVSIPKKIKIPHPLGEKTQGSAFVVKKIIYPINFESKSIQWLYKNNIWRKDKVPTRSEYLIKSGRGEKMRKYRAILVLKSPYIASVSV